MDYEEKEVDLEQFDWAVGEEIEKAEEDLAPAIGFFLIDFSLLENTLNIALAEAINSRSHEPGYVVVEKLGFRDKIDLFYKFYLRMVSLQGKAGKDELTAIRDRLESINTFRNIIAHANWATIDGEGFVRTKIKVNRDEGNVVFKHVKVTVPMIEARLSEVNSLEEELESFSEKVLQWGFEEKPEKSD